MDPQYGYQSVNVETQAGDPHSLLNWTRRMLAVRKQSKAFGRGTLKMLSPSNRRILAYTREYTGPDGKNEIILCVANVSRSAKRSEERRVGKECVRTCKSRGAACTEKKNKRR